GLKQSKKKNSKKAQPKNSWGKKALEIPALYTTPNLNRLWSYTGQYPFQHNKTLAELATGWSEASGFWDPGHFVANEHWAAMLNMAQWGVGLFSTDTVQFVGGFSAGSAGKKPDSATHPGSPSDEATAYLAAVGDVDLGAEDEYQYKYALVLGNLETIRNFAYINSGYNKK
ncbi:hypothetical protein CYMTET_34440, partial [Cymbomonas tetramitiformis]